MSPRLAAALLLAALAGCATTDHRQAEATREVEAEGWAPYDRRDPEGSRRRALADAQRKAAERVNGVTISASSLVAEAVSVRARILTETAGGVLDWDVLGRSVEDGFLKIRIRARVLLRPAGLPAQSPPLGLRVGVGVAQSGGDPALSRAAASALRRELLARGFSVAEPGSEARPDVAVTASVEVRPQEDSRLGAFRSSAAILTLRAASVPEGEVLWECVRRAAALELDAAGADRKAVESVAALAGRDAAAGLSRLCWQRR
ncbi:MAG: hypothetical protein PHF00_12115 [Elusimicrobia bacterium]|nr:hypothetical protein [Elusimicrobiota bacterium]